MTDVVWDFDFLKYTIGAVSEKRNILVTHKQTGNQKEFKTRTEFYGHYKKKEGGWLAEQNVGKLSPHLVDDFVIEDVQVADPPEVAMGLVRNYVNKVCKQLDTTSYYGYIGKGDSWRVGASTILKYKGSREGLMKPLNITVIEEYLKKHHAAEEVTELEADDVVVMDCTANPDLILVGIDKDYRGCTLNLFNPDKMGSPEKISGLGRLYVGSDKKVSGEGRMFLYHQVLSGDSSDEYAANSASDVKWGEKSSFGVLSKCSTDQQALQGMVDAYKLLYPEPKIITGWRGDSFEIDWLYVLQENFTMAHMLRHENDYINVKDLLTKMKVKF